MASHKSDNNLAKQLDPVRPVRLSEVVVDQITALIEEGHLVPGQQLPSERELMAQLQIGRTSVREALRILESQGLVQVQPGRGAFIANSLIPADILPALQGWLAEHQEELLEIVAVRELLESYASFQAAKCGLPPELLIDLQQSIVDMNACIERGEFVEVTHVDRRFHQLLFEASGNRFLKLIGATIVPALSGPRYSLLRIRSRALQSLREHEEIVAALAAGDPDGAQAATRRHIASIREAVIEIQELEVAEK